MNKDISVSVIIPIFNVSEYLEECLESVKRQTLGNIEVIMVDDGSKDESPAIAKRYANSEENWVFFQANHEGVSNARNQGISIAKGKYVFFLDSDDRIEPKLLELLYEKMEEKNAGIGASFVRKFGYQVSRNLFANKNKDVDCLDGETALVGFSTNYNQILQLIGGKMIRKDLLPEGYFRTDIRFGEDTFLMYQVLLKCYPVVFTDEAFYEYRIHKNNAVLSADIKRVKDIFYVRKYIADKEAENGRIVESEFWYAFTSDAFLNFCNIYSSDTYSGEDFKEFRKLLKEFVKDERFKKAPRISRFKIYLFIFAPKIFGVIANGGFVGENTCFGCEACADVCPNHCITIKYSRDGFRYPVTDKIKCNDCGLCHKVCPNEGYYDVANEQHFYGLQAKEDVRKLSTSGGAFRLLSEHVLSKGGVVIGAAMENLEVKHIVVDNIEDLNKLSGSKYVQSKTAGIYNQAKQYLKEGRPVLFSGTPCQVEAMRRIAGNNANLLLVDLICNGVASPGMWKKYTRLLSIKNRSRLLNFSFRDKRNKNDGHTVAMQFVSGEKTKSMYEDKFLRTYFNGASERRKCSSCLFSTERRQSDITIGDFWGVEEHKPQWNDGKGTSLLITHTKAGEDMIPVLKNNAEVITLTEKESRQARLLFPVGQSALMCKAKRKYKIIPFLLWLKEFSK